MTAAGPAERMELMVGLLDAAVRVNEPGAYAATRNPILDLPSVRRAQRTLSFEARFELRVILRDISAEARERADLSWRRHKGPMAAYWRAVAVYARHLSLAIKP